MKRKVILTGLLLATTNPILAHNLWVKPSQTILSGETAWVTFDVAASNDIFVFNHRPLDLDNIKVTSPSQSIVVIENKQKARLRSTFDLMLDKQGTYNINWFADSVYAGYEEAGKKKRWWGTIADLNNKNYPTGVKTDAIKQRIIQIETFTTLGSPSSNTIAPAKQGLDVEYITHPNDLFAKEMAKFKLLVDGQPVANHEISIIPHNSQYRNNTGEIKLKTNQDGEFNITWEQAGMYWLNTSIEDNKGITENKVRNLSYTAVLEVLPQ